MVIGRCGGDEHTEWPRRTDKSPPLKKENNESVDIYKEAHLMRSEWATFVSMFIDMNLHIQRFQHNLLYYTIQHTLSIS